MKLSELLQGLKTVSMPQNTDIEIKGIAIDSRVVKEGDLFICIKGSNDDGHNHALEAEMLGAAAIVAEHSVESSLPTVIIDNSRCGYSKISQNFFKNPILSMKFVTVVGTNGKTSTSIILNNLLTNAGYKTGLIGTLGYKIIDKNINADLTTPDPFMLNKLFYKMKQAGVEIVIAEVSAHAIALQKLYGIKSDVCIFTNVSQDHLDFFNDFENYANTKLSFFTPEHIRLAVVNSDDKYGQIIAKNARIPVITYGIDEPSDVFAINIENGESGTTFIINLFDEIYELKTTLFGKHNLYNVLGAVTVAKMLSISTACIAENLQNMPMIEGRFNIFMHKKGKIVVDFAHTPDGLQNLLLSARPLTSGRIITVFGCGGNRDRTKRSIMGDIAGRLSDFVILTSDNPRFEEPMDIINDILPSVIAVNDNVLAIENRKEAIRRAVELMNDGDMVIVAGKGGETHTEIKGKKFKSSDISEVKAIIRGEQ